MADCCDTLCNGNAPAQNQRKTLLWVLAINAVLFVVVLISALSAKSSSLMSGSIDNLGDAITYALSLYAIKRGDLYKAKVSFFKGALILFAAMAVSAQILYKLFHPEVPVFEIMGIITVVSLIANFTCLLLLWRHRDEDINMASVWECSRNDVLENLTVLLAALGVWLTQSQWPDIILALALVLMLFRSAFRILRRSRSEIQKFS